MAWPTCQAVGGQKRGRQKLPTDSTADTIASEENCSPRHVKNSAQRLEAVRPEPRARRNQTRTERNYYLGAEARPAGIRYLREKQPHGGQKRDGKKVPINGTAQLIAAEENCSDRHVKNSAKMAEHIEDLCCHLGHGALWVALFHRQKVQPVSVSAPSCGPWRLAYRGAGCAASSATSGRNCSRSSVTLWGVFSRPWVC